MKNKKYMKEAGGLFQKLQELNYDTIRKFLELGESDAFHQTSQS